MSDPGRGQAMAAYPTKGRKLFILLHLRRPDEGQSRLISALTLSCAGNLGELYWSKAGLLPLLNCRSP